MNLIKRLRSVTKSYPRTDTPIVGSVSTDTNQTVNIYAYSLIDTLAKLQFGCSWNCLIMLT